MILLTEITVSVLLIALNYIMLCGYLSGNRFSIGNRAYLSFNFVRILYIVIALLITGTEIILFQVLLDLEFIVQFKLIVLILIIIPCAAADFKIEKIPNRFLIEGLIIRAVLVIVELFAAVRSAVASATASSEWCGMAEMNTFLFESRAGVYAVLAGFIDEIVGAVVCSGFFLLMLLLFKNSIGMGDIKLFALIGLYKGLWGSVVSVFLSLCVSFVVSVFLLASKRKSRKDTLPFGPCILMGMFLSSCLFGM